ncbi:hypothetical protein N181_01015 [Sinorhizobium fredii USDA 205]|uniref:Uncharacterized protein n=1 Tax=Rhizobium fredii TaxID=380 RepID=A0A844AHA0_RHIFR|nr:hypothetical protein [Sinorhizobium fredii]KSV92744.1 hypothetical protein N181_01015 [Sinorhizobium fredii USDA 205]MQX10820.1 hypothetical protein [Sinorhizobium fredii]GEC31466.1 hypothetical protein EFR01_16370 [Sinorhizobium fredii]GLS09170.1 hypothetical protein GCM10007864_28000 [Sinorhizobium fredii]
MCRVDGCFRPATKFSHLCERHRNVARVHGDPLQRGITKADLKPYLKAIRDYLHKRSGPRAEAIISRDWERVLSSSQAFLERAERGEPHNLHSRNAALVVIDVDGEQHPTDIAVTLMALGYFYADQPSRWASDQGFQFQAVRMFRKLAKHQTDYSWTRTGQMIRSSAKRCPQGTTKALWQSITATGFIGYGIQIQKQIEKERRMRQKDRIADLREILGASAATTYETAE